MTDILDDEQLTPPGKPDFRRVGRWNSPSVVMPNGKRSTYGRFSNSGKILDDESNLTDWKLRTIIVGAAHRPELMAQVSTLNPQADKNELRDIAEECLTAGKGKERTVKGVAVHAMFDHLDLKDGWEPAPQWMDLCQSYLDTLELWGLVPEDIEVNCVSHRFRLAGRLDRRYRTTRALVAPDNRVVPIGSRIVADTKTGAVLEYAAGSYATQLAGYSIADRYDVTTDETIPFDPPTFPDWGLVVHADSGGTEVQMYWVDLNAGLVGLELSQEVKGWRQRAGLLHLGAGPVMNTGPRAAAAPSTVLAERDPERQPSSPPQAPVVPQEAPDSPQAPVAATLDTGARRDSLYQHTRDRVKAILDHSELAGKMLAREWPAGVPGLKVDQHTMMQLQAIIAVVEKVETEHSVPWFPHWVDPEMPAAMERHPSYVMAPKPEQVNPDVAAAVLNFMESIDTTGWPETSMPIKEQLTQFLDGTIRALGYPGGLDDLPNVKAESATGIVEAAFSITSGTAMLLYQADGSCILRTNIVKP